MAVRRKNPSTAAYLSAARRTWEGSERLVIPGVITNRMALLSDLSHERRVLLGCLANHKKRCTDLMLSQNSEQAGRIFGMWPVIERQGRNRITSCHVSDWAEPERLTNACAIGAKGLDPSLEYCRKIPSLHHLTIPYQSVECPA